jgi:hypothetical protein
MVRFDRDSEAGKRRSRYIFMVGGVVVGTAIGFVIKYLWEVAG